MGLTSWNDVILFKGFLFVIINYYISIIFKCNQPTYILNITDLNYTIDWNVMPMYHVRASMNILNIDSNYI